MRTATIGQSQAPSSTGEPDPWNQPGLHLGDAPWTGLVFSPLFYAAKILGILLTSQRLFSSDNQSLILIKSNGRDRHAGNVPQTSCGLYGERCVALKRKQGEGREEESAARAPGWSLTSREGQWEWEKETGGYPQRAGDFAPRGLIKESVLATGSHYITQSQPLGF